MSLGDQQGRAEVYYTLIATATIMTVLEVVAAYVLFFPETRAAIEKGMKKIPKSSGAMRTEQLGLGELRQIIKTARERERLNCKLVLNAHSYAFAFALIVALTGLTLAVRAHYLSVAVPVPSGVSPPLHASFLTVACLVPFQALFFYMSKYKWEYQNPFPMLAPIVLRSCAGVTPDTVLHAKAELGIALTDDYRDLLPSAKVLESRLAQEVQRVAKKPPPPRPASELSLLDTFQGIPPPNQAIKFVPHTLF